MVHARIFRRWIHYLHEPPSTPIFLPAKAVLIATILVVFSIGNAEKQHDCAQVSSYVLLLQSTSVYKQQLLIPSQSCLPAALEGAQYLKAVLSHDRFFPAPQPVDGISL